ncbi:MAG: patatin-like phospholipase domain-containing protein [Phycisphaerales bacterium]|nr:patatin-like phospholipase domain-containing protein [Phycisphaerales bacterium]
MSDAFEKAILYLTRSPLLRGVSEEILRSLDPPPEVVFLRAGETLIRQGDESSDYFLLISGRLHVFAESEGGNLKPIVNILPGEGVGEVALLTNEPRSGTVIARLDSEVVRFPQSTFLVLAVNDPLAALSIARTVINRAKRQTEIGRKHAAFPAIAMLSLTPAVDPFPLALNLKRELGAYGRSECVASDFKGDLDKLEEDFNFVIYAAGPRADAWSRKALVRADLVLLVVDVASTAEPGEIEGEMLGRMDRRVLGKLDLVLLHRDAWQRRSGAVRWLRRIHPDEHHHIRAGSAGDLARLARIIVGRANNVVLSGGGARAFAQIGALRALGEFRVPVDRIGGTSMGAAVAALRALDDGFDSAAQMMRRLFLQRRPATDYTLPLVSLLAGKKMLSIGLDVFTDWNIEDLPVRYFCISSDLGSGELIEHFDGPLWMGLRATTALPVVAPPFVKDGRMIVDGGVLNNLPIDVMREHFSGTLIAIDTSKHKPLFVDGRWDLTCPSGFEILKSKLDPFQPPGGLPSILEILRRSATLASERHAARARTQADLLIAPPVEKFSITDFACFDEIVENGYRHTVTLLKERTT